MNRFLQSAPFRNSVALMMGISIQLAGCTSSQNAEKARTLPPSYERGRTIYQTQCTACHNSNPHQPGSIGPDVFGSTKELLEARIIRGEYPPGYKPKRSSHVMAALPHLKGEIDSLVIYLNSNP